MSNKKVKTIKRSKLDPISMSVNHKLPTKVNDKGVIREYVGIGWIDVTDKTSPSEIKSLPILVD